MGGKGFLQGIEYGKNLHGISDVKNVPYTVVFVFFIQVSATVENDYLPCIRQKEGSVR